MDASAAEIDPPLVVDVDGTLLRTDLLVEGALAAAFASPLHVLGWPAVFARGKAPLKHVIAGQSPLDCEGLPLNENIMALLRGEKAKGRKIYMASASDRAWIDSLARALGIFDGWFASDGKMNLAGKAKADRLVAEFGARGFDYIGNDRVDLPVWAAARKALIADPSPGLLREAKTVNADVSEVGAAHGGTAGALLRAMRPHQWVKNLLIFLPMLAGHQLDTTTLLSSFIAFVAMSLCASGGYIINDLADLGADRRHPRKRQRPFASGAASALSGIVLSIAAVMLGLIFAATVSWALAGMVAGYFALSLFYSFVLKRKLVLDVFTLALLYTFRIGVGAVATSIVVSEWLLAFSMFLFMSLAMVKRCTELARLGENGAASQAEKVANRGYHASDVEVVAALAVASGFCAVLVLALYVNAPAATALYARPQLLWGICFLLAYWLGRIFVLARRGHVNDDPILFAFRDGASYAVGAGVAALLLLAL